MGEVTDLERAGYLTGQEGQNILGVSRFDPGGIATVQSRLASRGFTPQNIPGLVAHPRANPFLNLSPEQAMAATGLSQEQLSGMSAADVSSAARAHQGAWWENAPAYQRLASMAPSYTAQPGQIRQTPDGRYVDEFGNNVQQDAQGRFYSLSGTPLSATLAPSSPTVAPGTGSPQRETPTIDYTAGAAGGGSGAFQWPEGNAVHAANIMASRGLNFQWPPPVNAAAGAENPGLLDPALSPGSTPIPPARNWLASLSNPAGAIAGAGSDPVRAAYLQHIKATRARKLAPRPTM